MGFFHTLKFRLLFLMFIITLPGLIVILFQATNERNNAIQDAHLDAVNIVDNIAQQQADIIEETKSFLQRLSKSEILLTPSSTECSQYLANLRFLTDYYVNLGAPTAEGHLLCTSVPLIEPVNVSDRAYIQQSIANRAFTIGQFQFDRAVGKTSINFAYPIINPANDDVVGVTVAVVSLDWWSKQLEQANLSKESVAYITDANNKIIAVYPENKAQLGLSLDSVQHSIKSMSDQNVKMVEDSSGHLRIFVSRTLINLNGESAVDIVVGIPFEKALNIIDIRLFKMISVLIFCILICVVLAIFMINKSILKPLNALKESTKQLRLGQSENISSVEGTTELVELQEHFLLMAKTRLYAEQQLKYSQKFLQKSEARLSRHLQNTPLASIGWDKNYICTEWNRAAESIFGYLSEEAISQNIFDLIVDPKFNSEFYAQFALLLEHKGGTHFKSSNLTKDRSNINCSWHNTLILNTKDQVIGFGALVKDITKEKRNQDTLDNFFKLPMNLHVIVGFDDKIIKVNKGWETILGYTSSELIGSNIFALIHLDDMDKSILENVSVRQSHTIPYFENRYKTKKGDYRLIAWSGTSPIDEQTVYAIGVDITERRLTEDKLKLTAGVFTHAKEAVIISDEDNNIIDVNDAFIKISGYSKDESIGQKTSMFKSGLEGNEFYNNIYKTVTYEGHWTGEIRNKCKNGTIISQLLTVSTICDTSGKISNYIALYTDISAIKEQQVQLERIAHYDVLTGLPNRSLLADRLKQAMLFCESTKQSLAVVFLDLDGFKEINDNYGHNVGDKLLVEIAGRMQMSLREGDTLARFGGDEFVAVLGNLDKADDCEPLLEQLLSAVKAHFMIGNVAIKISASIGVTIYPHDNVDADQLLRHADQSMYTAKQEGKNRYHLFDMAQDIALKNKHEQLVSIDIALQKNEFLLYYQPKVNMVSGQVIGVEALIRWQHPERGLLPPIAFLPIIERHELTIKVGEWVIDTALAQITHWQKLGLNIVVSVNIDALQLQQVSFVERLSSLLAAHPDVPKGALQLEVLETSELADVKDVAKIMHACNELGVGFALDDFGTGYCSLTYLKRLPVNLIKIDQSFVFGMLDDPDDLSIVEGVMGLSKAFGLNVIAEGVETLEHGAALLRLGCHLAQGYGIARPMPANEVSNWIENWKPDKAWSKV